MLRSLWLLAACCIFLRRFCEAGILAPPPGHWNEAQHMWVATAEEDQLSDLIGAPLPDVPYVTPQAIHGMSFGDSNDRNIINDYCAKPEPHPPRHEIDSIRACWHANLTMTWQPLVGIHPTGPYWQGIQGSPPQRLEHGLIAQLRTFQSPPDFITFSSNLWDLWGWGNHKPEILSNDQVEAAALAEWAGHMSALMTQIEVCFKSRLALQKPCFRSIEATTRILGKSTRQCIPDKLSMCSTLNAGARFQR